jgi:hypothetical protein
MSAEGNDYAALNDVMNDNVDSLKKIGAIIQDRLYEYALYDDYVKDDNTEGGYPAHMRRCIDFLKGFGELLKDAPLAEAAIAPSEG